MAFSGPWRLTLGTLPGDYNRNGTVDAADYVVWRKGLGTSYIHEDYDVWRENFGQVATAEGSGSEGDSLSQTAVPEPAGIVLVCLGIAGLWTIVRSN